MLKLNPQSLKRLRRFREIKRGYYSFLFLVGLLVLVSFGELLVNSRALMVNYDDTLYFPTYSGFHAGTDFGMDYDPLFSWWCEQPYNTLVEKMDAYPICSSLQKRSVLGLSDSLGPSQSIPV